MILTNIAPFLSHPGFWNRNAQLHDTNSAINGCPGPSAGTDLSVFQDASMAAICRPCSTPNHPAPPPNYHSYRLAFSPMHTSPTCAIKPPTHRNTARTSRAASSDSAAHHSECYRRRGTRRGLRFCAHPRFLGVTVRRSATWARSGIRRSFARYSCYAQETKQPLPARMRQQRL